MQGTVAGHGESGHGCSGTRQGDAPTGIGSFPIVPVARGKAVSPRLQRNVNLSVIGRAIHGNGIIQEQKVQMRVKLQKVIDIIVHGGSPFSRGRCRRSVYLCESFDSGVDETVQVLDFTAVNVGRILQDQSSLRKVELLIGKDFLPVFRWEIADNVVEVVFQAVDEKRQDNELVCDLFQNQQVGSSSTPHCQFLFVEMYS